MSLRRNAREPAPDDWLEGCVGSDDPDVTWLPYCGESDEEARLAVEGLTAAG
jgi:hypothetical protein